MKSSLKYTINGLDKKGSVVSLLGTEKILFAFCIDISHMLPYKIRNPMLYMT